jgi:hypothetical protein
VSFAKTTSKPSLRLGSRVVSLVATTHAPLADLAIVFALRFARLEDALANASLEADDGAARLKLMLTFLFKKEAFGVAMSKVLASVADATAGGGVDPVGPLLPREGVLTHGDALAEKRKVVVAETWSRNVESAAMGMLAAGGLVAFSVLGDRIAGSGPPAVAGAALVIAYCVARAASVDR